MDICKRKLNSLVFTTIEGELPEKKRRGRRKMGLTSNIKKIVDSKIERLQRVTKA